MSIIRPSGSVKRRRVNSGLMIDEDDDQADRDAADDVACHPLLRRERADFAPDAFAFAHRVGDVVEDFGQVTAD